MKKNNVKKTIEIALSIMNTQPSKIVNILTMCLSVIDKCVSTTYEDIVKEMCDLVYNLPKKDYLITNNTSVAITFTILEFVAEGKASMKKMDQLAKIYKKASQLSREQKTDKKAFKVISTM